jgi:citrate lyase subunit beta/citryl-CoA lyase
MAFLRSFLFAPGSREDLLGKVFDAGADAVVLDLEDAVPQDQKLRARELVAAAIDRRASPPGPAVFVRINSVGTALWEADLAAAVRRGVSGIRLPKVEYAADVQHADRMLGMLELQRGLAPGTIELALTLESARGIESSTALAEASGRVRNLCFGAADFVADVGAESSPSESETLYARSRMVISSRLAGLDPPIAAAFTSLHDDEGLRESCEASRRLGFFGRSCLHPRQVPVVNTAFEPRPEDLDRARRIVGAWQQAANAGLATVKTADGWFVDPATLRQARALLSLASRFREGGTT